MTTKLFALTLTIILLLSQSSVLLGQNVPPQQDIGHERAVSDFFITVCGLKISAI